MREKLFDSFLNLKMAAVSPAPNMDEEVNPSHFLFLQSVSFFVIMLGLLVIVGWHTRSELLIQIIPQAAPMQYNTALCFMLSGIGFYALANNHYRPLMVICGGSVAIIGLVTLAQYFFSTDFGIDRLFMEPYIAVRTSHPGRMAPNTALCFLLTGLILVLIVSSRHHGKLNTISLLSGMSVLAVSLMALLGYAQNIEAAYGWGQLTRMAVHTGLGFVVLGIGITQYHFLELQKRRKISILPLWISFFLMAASLAFDLSSPLGIAAGVAYIPIVFCSLWFPLRGMPFIFAIVLSGLVIVGFFAVPDIGVSQDIVLINRTLSIIAIWIVATIVYLQRLALKALAESRMQLKLILDHARTGICGINRQGQTVFANKEAANILGYTQEEMLNASFSNIVRHCSVDGTPYNPENNGIYAVLNNGKVHSEDEDVFLHKNGRAVSIEYTSAPERDQDGNITGAVIAFKDVTSRKNNENKIKSTLSFKDLVMSNIPHPVFVKDAEFKIVQANQAFISFYPKEKQNQIIGSTTLEQYQPEEAELFLKNDKQAFAEGYAECEETIHFPNGEKRILFTKKIRFENEHAEKFILAVSRDITDTKKAEAERLAFIDKLTNSNEELGRFAYVASHDLQEPLRMVTNFTKLLESRYGGQLDDQAKEYIHIASSSALRMQMLVSDLLEYARMEEETERYEEVSLEQTMHIVEENLKDRIDRSGALIKYNDLPVITSNPVRIMQLMQNLVGNALKYQAEDNSPEIQIHAKKSGEGEWTISVADNGIGMRQEYCKKIFEPFKRLHGKKEYPGTGMGLAICRKIVEGFGGRIWAESEPAKGSIFYFTISDKL